jgi:hypothetical protein
MVDLLVARSVDERGIVTYLLDGLNEAVTSLANVVGKTKRDLVDTGLARMQGLAERRWIVHLVDGGPSCGRCGAPLPPNDLPSGRLLRIRDRRGYRIAEHLGDRQQVLAGEVPCV